MTRYLVDTNVVSAIAPGAVSTPVMSWVVANEPYLAISVVTVTVAEIESGVAKLRREGRATKAARFADWLNRLRQQFADRVIPFDIEAARVAGLLQDKARGLGRDPGFADIAIAATAVRHGLVLGTLNVRHFEPLGIDWVDPSQT